MFLTSIYLHTLRFWALSWLSCYPEYRLYINKRKLLFISYILYALVFWLFNISVTHLCANSGWSDGFFMPQFPSFSPSTEHFQVSQEQDKELMQFSDTWIQDTHNTGTVYQCVHSLLTDTWTVISSGQLKQQWSHCDKWQVTPGQHMENIKKKLKETILQMVGGVMLPLGGCRQRLLWKYLGSVTARIGCTFLNIP